MNLLKQHLLIMNFEQAGLFLLAVPTLDAGVVGEPQADSNSCSDCSGTENSRCCSADVADEEVGLMLT